MEIIWILLGLLVLVGLGLIISYNGLIRLRNKTDESWSGIDVQLKRRHDLIPNLVNTVKGYATHEREVLQNVTEARNQAMNAQSPAAAGQAEGILGGLLGKVFALAEAYPDLKANQNFLELQTELANTEDQISASRRIYNGNVQAYNTKMQSFPALLYAGAMGFKTREFFEIENPQERDVVQVSF